jgi:predicted ATPase
MARWLIGVARAQLGRASEGIAMIRRATAVLLGVGYRIGITYWSGLLAAAQERDGAMADARKSVERALQANPDEVLYRPEILRLRGELRPKLGQQEPAERDFCEAIELARSMGGKAWELRATMSLARLLRDTGRRDDASTMLAAIYNSFTEGFDTADLKDAKALLGQLGN